MSIADQIEKIGRALTAAELSKLLAVSKVTIFKQAAAGRIPWKKWSAILAWSIQIEDGAKKDLAKLDKQIAKRITDFLRNRIAPLENPRSLGHALQGKILGNLWTYRTGDYRIVCEIQDKAVRILVVRIGNRREVYR